MEIRKVPISLLNAAPYNPRKDLQPGDLEYQKIARSIEKYGCVEPIIWNEKTGNVIGGHQRLKVLAATGAVEVDVSVVQLSLEDEKALNLALNKISGQWDNEKLSAVLQDLGHGDLCGHQLRLRSGLGAYPRGPDAAYRYHHRAVSSESLSGAVGYPLFLFLHKKCRPPLTASCSVRSVFRLPV